MTTDSTWCVCVSVSGVQVVSCFCFLGADTGVNIQKMMSASAEGPDGRTKPSSVSTETCQTSKQSAVQQCVCVWGGLTWHWDKTADHVRPQQD